MVPSGPTVMKSRSPQFPLAGGRTAVVWVKVAPWSKEADTTG